MSPRLFAYYLVFLSTLELMVSTLVKQSKGRLCWQCGKCGNVAELGYKANDLVLVTLCANIIIFIIIKIQLKTHQFFSAV